MFFNHWIGFGDYISAGTLHIQIALRNSSTGAPSPSDNSPRAGRLGINEVAATIGGGGGGGGGGQIKPLVGGGCWWTWQSGIQQTEGITSICVSMLEVYSITHLGLFPDYYLMDKSLPKLIPFLKSSMRPWEVTGSGRGALRPLTVASCRAPSQKPWLLLFWSLSAPAHVTFPVKRALPGPQKPEECFKSLPWPHSRARWHQGPRLLSRNSTLRFSRLPFSLTLQHLALLL